jgi:hypothetical protein
MDELMLKLHLISLQERTLTASQLNLSKGLMRQEKAK